MEISIFLNTLKRNTLGFLNDNCMLILLVLSVVFVGLLIGYIWVSFNTKRVTKTFPFLISLFIVSVLIFIVKEYLPDTSTDQIVFDTYYTDIEQYVMGVIVKILTFDFGSYFIQ